MVVLRLGPAIAVLSSCVGPGRPDHDRIATAELIAATGRCDIAVERRPSGRPRLAPPYPELGVSLSWRDGLLLAGFDPEGAVGVDVEPADRSGRLEAGRLARDHFAPGEAEAVKARSGDNALDLFLRLWVAKEAVLKLTGRGVFDGMHRPDLGCCIASISGDGLPIRLQATPGHPAVEVAVARPTGPGLPSTPPYCALARAL